MLREKIFPRPLHTSFQEQLIHGSRLAINRSYELLHRTEHLVRPGLPIVPTRVSVKDRGPASRFPWSR